LTQYIRVYTIANVNENIGVKLSNENNINPDENYYSEEVLRKSACRISEVKIKEDIEVDEEQTMLQAVEIEHKEEIDIFEEPIAFTGTSYLVKNTGEKPYQCSQCDEALSCKSALIRHQR
ncbi:unnamed protein product, partial [Meganyctiphanes norvegica]